MLRKQHKNIMPKCSASYDSISKEAAKVTKGSPLQGAQKMETKAERKVKTNAAVHEAKARKRSVRAAAAWHQQKGTIQLRQKEKIKEKERAVENRRINGTSPPTRGQAEKIRAAGKVKEKVKAERKVREALP